MLGHEVLQDQAPAACEFAVHTGNRHERLVEQDFGLNIIRRQALRRPSDQQIDAALAQFAQ